MTTANSIEEIFSFLDVVMTKGFIKKNTVIARRTACNKFFSVLEDENRNAEYIRDHLEVIKKRYQNLNPQTTGLTIDEYARRVNAVIDDFLAWKEDRGAWERQVSSKKIRDTKKVKREKAFNTNDQDVLKSPNISANTSLDDESSRYVSFPLSDDFEGQIKFPRKGLSKAEAMRYLMVVLSNCRELHDVKPADVEFLLSQNA